MTTQQFDFNENRDKLISLTTHSGEQFSGINLGLMPDGIILIESQEVGYMKLTEVEAKDIKTVTILKDEAYMPITTRVRMPTKISLTS